MVFLITFCVVALPLMFSAANTTEKSCTTASQTTGKVTFNESPAFDAYFDKPWLKQLDTRKENAKRIIEIGNSRDESAYSIQTALGTAMQESGLLNLPKGDRDSLGLFQQRPSQGWGTVEQIMNVTDSTTAFYDALDRVPGSEDMSFKNAAIAVQIPNLQDYESWHWDKISNELVFGAKPETCGSASGAHAPLDEGYIISRGGKFNDSGYGGTKPHKGIDFSGYAGGSSGKPVYAALPGIVVVSPAGYGCLGNNVLTIVSDDGLEVTYMHMNGDNVTVNVGDNITTGQQIGKIGNCGDSTGAHLHFEVSPGTSKQAWIDTIPSVQKFGSKFLDPVAVMNHYGVDITP